MLLLFGSVFVYFILFWTCFLLTYFIFTHESNWTLPFCIHYHNILINNFLFVSIISFEDQIHKTRSHEHWRFSLNKYIFESLHLIPNNFFLSSSKVFYIQLFSYTHARMCLLLFTLYPFTTFSSRWNTCWSTFFDVWHLENEKLCCCYSHLCFPP